MKVKELVESIGVDVKVNGDSLVVLTHEWDINQGRYAVYFKNDIIGMPLVLHHMTWLDDKITLFGSYGNEVADFYGEDSEEIHKFMERITTKHIRDYI